MINNGLFQMIGLFLLGLGFFSGIALFLKAVKGKAEGKETLWGLFIIGMAAGTFLMVAK